jgi:hypothetical protein
MPFLEDGKMNLKLTVENVDTISVAAFYIRDRRSQLLKNRATRNHLKSIQKSPKITHNVAEMSSQMIFQATTLLVTLGVGGMGVIMIFLMI